MQVASGLELDVSGARSLDAESFSAIRAECPHWLWQGWILLGAVTLLVGREKLGKSTLSTELAARLSRGILDGDLLGRPADTLIVSYEDSASTTIKPRLMAARADLKHVHRVRARRGKLRDLVSLPDDVERIEELARERHARLIVVDPLSASLNGEVNAHRDQDIRRALVPLVQLAEEADLAILALAHWNKAQGGDSLSRVLGSRGLTAAVRFVLAFGRAPDADEGSRDRVLAHAACNLAQEAPSLACRIEGREIDGEEGEVIPTSALVILGETDAHADDLLVTRTHDDRTQSEEATEWLEDELADGERHPSRDVKAAANAAGISDKALRTAREQLGVQYDKRGFPPRSMWHLPFVPPTPSAAGHEPTGHDRKPSVDTGDSGDSAPRSCPVSGMGTNGAQCIIDWSRPQNGVPTDGDPGAGVDADAELERILAKYPELTGDRGSVEDEP